MPRYLVHVKDIKGVIVIVAEFARAGTSGLEFMTVDSIVAFVPFSSLSAMAEESVLQSPDDKKN